MEKDTIYDCYAKWMIHLSMTQVVASFTGPAKLSFFHGCLQLVATFCWFGCHFTSHPMCIEKHTVF